MGAAGSAWRFKEKSKPECIEALKARAWNLQTDSNKDPDFERFVSFPYFLTHAFSRLHICIYTSCDSPGICDSFSMPKHPFQNCWDDFNTQFTERCAWVLEAQTGGNSFWKCISLWISKQWKTNRWATVKLSSHHCSSQEVRVLGLQQQFLRFQKMFQPLGGVTLWCRQLRRVVYNANLKGPTPSTNTANFIWYLWIDLEQLNDLSKTYERRWKKMKALYKAYQSKIIKAL